MSDTYALRAARLARLAEALAVLGDGQAELRATLQSEHDALQSLGRHASDRAVLLVTADWLWVTPAGLLQQVEADPALTALGAAPALTADGAAAVEALPRGPGDPPPDLLDQVRVALGGDEAALAELTQAAFRAWLALPAAERPSPFDEVATLLPLRLETLFDPPDSPQNPDLVRWKLSLRAIPDEAAVRRDSPAVTADERAALERFWLAVMRPEGTPDLWLDSPDGRVAWAELCAQVAPPRAAALVAALPPEPDGSVTLPPERQGEPLPNRVGGLPPALELWAITAEGAAPLRVGRLPADEARQIDPAMLVLPLPGQAIETPEERAAWWGSWAHARAAGLGDEWLLEDGLTPESIVALYVVGLGDETPAEHMRAQVEAGELGLLRLGRPTNTVHGVPAAPLARDPASWHAVALARLRGERSAAAARAVSRHLAGDEAALPPFPGADAADDAEESRRLLHALWPALWGHWLRDLWQHGEEADRTAAWALAHVLPEGPLAPIRISEQPYGLLPATALSIWRPNPAEALPDGLAPDAEARMAWRLAALRDALAAAARTRGTSVGRDSAHWLDLVSRPAASTAFIWREFLPAEAFYAQYRLDGADRGQLLDEAVRLYRAAIEVMEGREPLGFPLTSGHWRPSRLPLVQPRRAAHRRGPNLEVNPAPLQEILTELLDGRPLELLFGEMRYRSLPDSLLLRLLFYAAEVAAPWRRGVLPSPTRLVVELHEIATMELAAELDQPGWQRADLDRRGRPYFWIAIPVERRAQLERALGATLDTAAHRVDPWATGLAWQRLKTYSASARRDHRLGAYGWVDGPFRGTPGPTDRGLLHAPSYGQALAAVVLRDRHLSDRAAGVVNETGDTPWAMNLSSPTVRLAEEIADEVRLGCHIYEIVGRRVEEVLDNHQLVKLLRTSDAYAMRPERKDPNEVCNGMAALPGLLAGDPAFPLTAAQEGRLRAIVAALDAYGDLLVADGALQLVNRQVDRAAELMDAAAGFARPPSLEFIQTPPSGYQLESCVLGALPLVDAAGIALGDHPLRLAEPSLAAFVATAFGDGWAWTAFDPAQPEAPLGAITLAQLGLGPLEALALPEALLGRLALQSLGLSEASIAGPRELQLARQLLTVLGSRPAAGRDLVGEQAAPAVDGAVQAELQARYDRLHAACGQAVADLLGAADDDALRVALRAALRWGIAPVAEPADEAAVLALLLDAAPPDGATPLVALAERVAAALSARLNAAPAPAAAASQEALRAEPPVETLAQALATLATADGKLSIMAAWEAGALSAATGVDLAGPKPTLDERWLTVAAAVRPPLARLEALQLEAAALTARTSASDDDPWRQAAVAENLELRKAGLTELRQPRLVALYGPEASWAAPGLAVAMIDAFSEALPLPQRATAAAFGFNAPAARAPQVILLAVPPGPRQRLTPALLAQIVHETRLLAQARGARLEDLSVAGLGPLHALLPSSWLQTSGERRVHLEHWPLFE